MCHKRTVRDPRRLFDTDIETEGYYEQGERRLLKAMLERAMLDLKIKDRTYRGRGYTANSRYRKYKQGEYRRDTDYQSAKRWIESRRTKDDLFSFEYCCFQLDLDPKKIKDLLKLDWVQKKKVFIINRV